MDTIIKILKAIGKIIWKIFKAFLKVVQVMVIFMFAVVFGTKESNKRQYDAEYYGYE